MIDLQQSGAGLAGYALLAAQAEALFADERDSSPTPRSSPPFSSMSWAT